MNTRLDVFEQYRTIFSNSSRILDTLNKNYSYTIKRFGPNELLGRDRTTRFGQTVRTRSGCSSEIGVFGFGELFELGRTIRLRRTVRTGSDYSIYVELIGVFFFFIYLFKFNKI